MEPLTTYATITGAASLAGAYWDRRNARTDMARSEAMQREFAQNGIRWRVEDAKAAGVHPLFALGAQTASFSPTVVGSEFGRSMASAGQDISRAAYASMKQEEKMATSLEFLKMQGQYIDNQIKLEQLRRLQDSPTVGVPMPDFGGNPNLTGLPTIPGQGDIKNASVAPGEPYVKYKSNEMSHVAPGSGGSRTIGAYPDVSFAKTAQGGLAIMPGPEIAQIIEDKIILEALWAIRNGLAYNMGYAVKPSQWEFPLPEGYEWEWSKAWQQFLPEKKWEKWDVPGLSELEREAAEKSAKRDNPADLEYVYDRLHSRTTGKGVRR